MAIGWFGGGGQQDCVGYHHIHRGPRLRYSAQTSSSNSSKSPTSSTSQASLMRFKSLEETTSKRETRGSPWGQPMSWPHLWLGERPKLRCFRLSKTISWQLISILVGALPGSWVGRFHGKVLRWISVKTMIDNNLIRDTVVMQPWLYLVIQPGLYENN